MIEIELLEWIGGALIVCATMLIIFIKEKRDGKN